MDTLQAFKDLVGRRCGLAFDVVAEANLASALAQRMEITGADGPSRYYAILAADEGEFQELVTLLTINETYFFREPAQMALLAEILVPQRLANRGDRAPVRILSAGCSTGEEPYSMAIALKEKFGDSAAHLVSITAVDLDHRALATAHRAEYGEYSFRALPPALRDRHFVPQGTRRWRLCESLRRQVSFHPLNLLSAPYPSGIGEFDIVFFRNVSIYFDLETRKTALSHLHAAMDARAALVVGASETLANDLGVFRLVGEGGAFYFTKDAEMAAPPPVRVQSVPPPPVPALRPGRPVIVSAAPPPDPIGPVRLLLREKRYDEALEQIAAAAPGGSLALVLEGYVRLLMRQFAAATGLASEAARLAPWSVDAYMLLGLAAKWQDEEETAIGAFRRVVYVRPQCWPAHYYLATTLQATEPAKARREYATALRQIVANPDPDGGLALPLDLPVADIRFLCQRQGLESEGSAGAIA